MSRPCATPSRGNGDTVVTGKDILDPYRRAMAVLPKQLQRLAGRGAPDLKQSLDELDRERIINSAS